MPPDSSLRVRLVSWLAGLWAIGLGLSYGTIRLAFPVHAAHLDAFHMAFVIGGLVVVGGSLALAAWLVTPLAEFLAAPEEDRQAGSSALQRALSAHGRFPTGILLLALGGPLLHLLVCGLALAGGQDGEPLLLVPFVLLGLLQGTFQYSLLMSWPASWSGQWAARLSATLPSDTRLAEWSLAGRLQLGAIVGGVVPPVLLVALFVQGSAQTAEVWIGTAGLCALMAAGLLWSLISGLRRGLARYVEQARLLAKGMASEAGKQVLVGEGIVGMGEALALVAERMRSKAASLGALSGEVEEITAALKRGGSGLDAGTREQAHGVDETIRSLEQLSQNVRIASSGLGTIGGSAQETVEAAQKVGESFNLMLTDMGTLQDTIERTARDVELIGSSSTGVSTNMSSLHDGVERTAQAVHELSATAKVVVGGAGETVRFSRKAIEVAQEGAVAVRRTIEGMDRIVDTTRQALVVIVGLGNRIEAIGSILGVIEEIADQTNLLALNAAIIAAQAGEHGRSFAVVADEIRSLAERTSSSTREIGQMIEDIQEASEQAVEVMKGGTGNVNEGVKLAKQAGDALNQILISVQKATQTVEQIARNTQGQEEVSEQAAAEINQVLELARQIAEVAGQQRESSEGLQAAFAETMSTTRSLGRVINQQAQENRQTLASAASMNESATRAGQVISTQSMLADELTASVEHLREWAQKHTGLASDVKQATEVLAEKSARLQEEIQALGR